jgi:predicted transposase/invertase (TIGR01784 family)
MAAPSNPHDALFRALVDDIDRAAAMIRDHLPADLTALLADTPPRLRDATFVDEELRSSQSDRLFEVSLRDGRPALLYVLLEHKSTPDPRTPLQLLGYMVRIWDRYASREAARLAALPPIIPLVFYHGERPWTVATSILDCIDATDEVKAHLRDLRYILRDLGPIAYEQLSRQQALRAGLGALKFAFAKGLTPDLLVQVLRDLPDGDALETQILVYIVAVYDTAAATLTQALAQAKPGREGLLMPTIAQEWIKQGKDEGWAQGKAEGWAEAKAESILLVLETRFGPATPEVREGVRRTAPDHLDRLFQRALTAQSLDAVFDGSVQH